MVIMEHQRLPTENGCHTGTSTKAIVSNGDHPGSNGTRPRKTRQSQHLKRRPSGLKRNPAKENTSKPASQTETIRAQTEPGQGKHVKASISNGDHPGSNGTQGSPSGKEGVLYGHIHCVSYGEQVKSQRLNQRPSELKRNPRKPKWAKNVLYGHSHCVSYGDHVSNGDKEGVKTQPLRLIRRPRLKRRQRRCHIADTAIASHTETTSQTETKKVSYRHSHCVSYGDHVSNGDKEGVIQTQPLRLIRRPRQSSRLKRRQHLLVINGSQ
jgi:hypothetical protein